MKTYDSEILFVKKFVVPDMRERLIFELSTPKKRSHAIRRFCHTTDDLIMPNVIRIKDNKLSKAEILHICTDLNANTGTCYVISFDTDMDATEASFADALNSCIGFGMPSIIILDSNNVVIETEQSFGPSTKYILHAY